MVDSVFTKIIRGEIPCYKLYEDDKTFAFLTIEPFVPGHTLVIPKVQIENFDDLPPAEYEAVFRTVKLLSKRLKAVFTAEKVAILVTGFHVPHVHVHLIPVADRGEFLRAMSAHLAQEVPYPYAPSNEELQLVAEKINREEK